MESRNDSWKYPFCGCWKPSTFCKGVAPEIDQFGGLGHNRSGHAHIDELG